MCATAEIHAINIKQVEEYLGCIGALTGLLVKPVRQVGFVLNGGEKYGEAVEAYETVAWKKDDLYNVIVPKLIDFTRLELKKNVYSWSSSHDYALRSAIDLMIDQLIGHKDTSKAKDILVSWLAAKGLDVTALKWALSEHRDNGPEILGLCSRVESTVSEIETAERQMADCGVLEMRQLVQGSLVGTLPEPKDEVGYEFAGWWTAAEGGEPVTEMTEVKENLAVYAHWTKTTFSLSFDSRTEQRFDERTLAYDERIGELPMPIREGYVFGGWIYERSGKAVSILDFLSADEILDAQWTKNTDWQGVGGTEESGWMLSVTFEANGGNVSMYSRSVNLGATLGELPMATREGYDFLGWFTAAVGGTQVTAATVVMNDVTFYAHWKCLSSDGEIVPGETVTIDTRLVGYTASGLPSGLKYDKKTGKITGAAKKPTAAEGAVVTFKKSGAETEQMSIVIGPMPKLSIAMAGDTEKCKVTGAGSYLVGKKVSLKATAPKGTAFAGWFADGKPWPSAAECRTAKLSYVMTKTDVSLVAKFEKEKMSVASPKLSSASFTVGVAGSAEGIPIEIETQSGVKSVKVSKLPGGMKYDKKSGLIVGMPTKAGKFEVVIAVTAKSGAVEEITVPIEVAALPPWASGTFGGMVGRFAGSGNDDEFRPYGMITMKITPAGKITAKVTAGGKSYSFTAKGFDAKDEDGDYHFRMATRKGEVYEGEISEACHDLARLVQGGDADDPEGEFAIAGRNPYFAIVWRNEHGKDGRLAADPTGKAKKAMDAVKAFKAVELAQFDPAYGTLALKIDAKGTTKLAGKTATGVAISGSSFLMLDDSWYHVLGDMVFYDKKSGLVYHVTPCFQPVFDAAGNVAGWDWECCEHDLKVYPFE